jgi:predicted Ser/Thr protein kinase
VRDLYPRHLCVLSHVLLDIDSKLDSMCYSSVARYNPDKECLWGTRQDIIENIVEWVNEPSQPDTANVFLLCGVAGSGKSAIVHTIASRFDKQGRLGSSFCFDRSDAGNRRVNQLFSTIARDLAYHDNEVKRALWSIVEKNISVLSTSTCPLTDENDVNQ